MASLSNMLAPSLEVGSTILNAGSQLARGQGYANIGARRAQEANFEADQLDTEAQGSLAVGQRNAADQALQTKMVNSLALARAAASGAGASDPTVMSVMAQTAGMGAYRQALAMYEGEAQARLDTMRGTALRFQAGTELNDAAAARSSANVAAVSTVLSGGSKTMSMMDKYWSQPGGGA